MTPITISIIAIIVALLMPILQYFLLLIRVFERLTAVETINQVFMKCLEGNLGNLLRSPKHIDRDLLMEKYLSNTITTDELYSLNAVLKEDIDKAEYNDKLPLCVMQAIIETTIHSNKLIHSKKWIKK